MSFLTATDNKKGAWNYSSFSASLLCAFLSFVHLSCVDHELKGRAQRKANEIIGALDSESLDSLLSKKYFAQEDIGLLIGNLRDVCDYKNRRGGFVNDFYERDVDEGPDKVTFIYEYLLKCDSIRILLTFHLNKDPQVVRLNIEPIEDINVMVDKEKQILKNQIQ